MQCAETSAKLSHTSTGKPAMLQCSAEHLYRRTDSDGVRIFSNRADRHRLYAYQRVYCSPTNPLMPKHRSRL